MSRSANVTSVEVITEFRLALSAFVEEAREALEMAELSMRRVVDWLEHDQRSYWRSQLRRRQQAVEQARLALQQRQLSGTKDHRPDSIEQRKALQAARRHLAEAEEKIANVGHWSRATRRAVDEYRARVQTFVGLIDADPPPVLTALKRIGLALDSYLAVAPPSSESRVTQSGGPIRQEDESPSVARLLSETQEDSDFPANGEQVPATQRDRSEGRHDADDHT